MQSSTPRIRPCLAVVALTGRSIAPQVLRWSTSAGCSVDVRRERRKLTRGYKLPARHIVHTVVPVWQGGSNAEPDLPASCYRRSLEVAASAGIRSIAFPSIRTGIYDYPIEAAATVATTTVKATAPDRASTRSSSVASRMRIYASTSVSLRRGLPNNAFNPDVSRKRDPSALALEMPTAPCSTGRKAGKNGPV